MQIIGVDGCKWGWVAVCFDTNEVSLFRNVDALLMHYNQDFFMLIDIPIGLPSAQEPYRSCEKEARKLLPKGRKSSIFPVPCRESLNAEIYSAASEINREILGCGISKQTWFIMPKIKEVDSQLIKNQALRSKIKESHPELSFQFLNVGKPLVNKKKTHEGATERLDILMKYDQQSSTIFNKALLDYRRAAVLKDDILDAMCLAITAAHCVKSMSRVPTNPIKDAFGIEMAIYYSKGSINT